MLRLLGVSSVSLKYFPTNDYNLAIESEKVQGWSCGLKKAQTSCVSGIPDGVQFQMLSLASVLRSSVIQKISATTARLEVERMVLSVAFSLV